MSPKEYHAQVAPDYPLGSPKCVDQYNTLVLRPDYRVSIHFDPEDMDLLFPRQVSADAGDDDGKKARLHALSFFSLLPNRKLNVSFYGKPDKWDGKACLDETWKYFCKLHNVQPANLTHAANLDELKKWTREKIVDGGALPAKGQWGKIYIPGGYAMTDNLMSPTFFDKGHVGKKKKKKTTSRWLFEQEHLKGNEHIGLIPIHVKVERKDLGSSNWVPAEGVQVYIQLVDPDDAQPANALPHDPLPPAERPEAAGADAQTYIDEVLEAYPGHPLDPQRDNCPAELGGKRGNDVAGDDRMKNIFEIDKEREGFHKAKPETKSGQEMEDWFKGSRPNDSRKDYVPAKKSTNDEIPNAVRVSTNEIGEGGVIFMPSLCGGDRYKIRAIIGQPAYETDGKEIETDPDVEHVAETGTIVIWRRARVSQVLAPPNQGGNAGLNALGCGNASKTFKEYNKGYTHIEFDVAAMTRMTQAEWQVPWAAARIHALANHYTKDWYYLDQLLPANINSADPSGCWIQMKSATDYNTAAAAAGHADGKLTDPMTANEGNSLYSLAQSMMTQTMLNLTKNGYIPGITEIRARKDHPGDRLWGMAMDANGCFTFGNNSEYPGYHIANRPIPMEVTAVHEAAHSWLLRHQHTDSGEYESGVWKACQDVLPLHEHYFEKVTKKSGKPRNRTARATKICLMSYHTDMEIFCGKCILAIRGWNVARIEQN